MEKFAVVFWSPNDDEPKVVLASTKRQANKLARVLWSKELFADDYASIKVTKVQSADEAMSDRRWD